MSLVGECWRGERPLGVVFWGYYTGFISAYATVLGLLVYFLPKPLKLFIAIPGVLFLLTYTVWILVSIWRCAKNSKPVWRVFARIWVVWLVVGGAGIFAATWIESYQYYLNKAKQAESRSSN